MIRTREQGYSRRPHMPARHGPNAKHAPRQGRRHRLLPWTRQRHSSGTCLQGTPTAAKSHQHAPKGVTCGPRRHHVLFWWRAATARHRLAAHTQGHTKSRLHRSSRRDARAIRMKSSQHLEKVSWRAALASHVKKSLPALRICRKRSAPPCGGRFANAGLI